MPMQTAPAFSSALLHRSANRVVTEAAVAPEIGAPVAMTLRYRMLGQEVVLACRGEVVGVECHGEGYHVAVRLRQPLFTEAELECLP